jgi:hypothetical protein
MLPSMTLPGLRALRMHRVGMFYSMGMLPASAKLRRQRSEIRGQRSEPESSDLIFDLCHLASVLRLCGWGGVMCCE